MAQSTPGSGHEPWTSVASTYGSNVGRTSSLLANRLLQLAQPLFPISSSSLVLDNGAGAGAVTFAVANQSPQTQIVATDISASMLSNISAQNIPGVSTRVLDAMALSTSLGQKIFTHVFNTFVLQTITTPLDALREMYKVLKPGGVVGIGIWQKRNGPFDIWEEACQIIDPGYKLPTPFPDPEAWRTQEELEGALKRVGFNHVTSEEVTMPFVFDSAEAFAEFMFEDKNPAMTQCMSNWKGSLDEVRNTMINLVKFKYTDGKEIYVWAVLSVGTKP